MSPTDVGLVLGNHIGGGRRVVCGAQYQRAGRGFFTGEVWGRLGFWRFTGFTGFRGFAGPVVSRSCRVAVATFAVMRGGCRRVLARRGGDALAPHVYRTGAW